MSKTPARKTLIAAMLAAGVALPVAGASMAANADPSAPPPVVAKADSGFGAAAKSKTVVEPLQNKSPKAAKQWTKRFMHVKYGWGPAQYRALAKLWTRESNWHYREKNGSSGAYGIPQSLPAKKMASAGKDWRTNPQTQIEWGLKYIKRTYGHPTAAWAHSQASNWY